ncbi:hypothetical protein AHAS_Ahas13G0012400 [Arachis hypogaea]
MEIDGIAKTTHATALYDRISYQFDASCFVENVCKIYMDGGAMAIQKQILRQALDEKNLDTYSPSEISGIITNRLHSIKVLVVLDNVDHLKQLEELAIKPKLLCEGSRIIITTRDEHILCSVGVREAPSTSCGKKGGVTCKDTPTLLSVNVQAKKGGVICDVPRGKGKTFPLYTVSEVGPARTDPLSLGRPTHSGG